MEASGVWFCLGVVVVFVWYGLKFLNWVWFKPKKIEKFLRKQGLKGSSYRFLYGDGKDMGKMLKEAQSKPINLSDDIVSRILPFEQKTIANYGKICFTWMGPKPLVHITEPTMVKKVLTNNYQFQKQKGRNPLINLVASGLAHMETDKWGKGRKIINPAFHVEKLKNMVPAVHMSCLEMFKKWDEMLKIDSSWEADVWPYLQTLTSDVISRASFEGSFEEGKIVFQLQQELANLAVETMRSMYIPGSSFLPTKRNKRMKEIDRQVKDSIRSIIDKHVLAMKEGKSNDDLLSMLLDSNDKTIKQQGNEKLGLSMDEIIEECKEFYFAGQDTTSSLLVWTMVLLGQHTNWQALARDEVLLAFGEKKPDINGLNRLKTVTMIFNEVLRLYSPIAFLGRMVHQETKLGDITLPAGSFLQLNTMLLHYDSDIWGDDVKEFNPERFSEGVLKVTKGQTVYLPFGGGPRVCIGQNFALLEAKMALAMILQHYRFDISPSYSHAPHTMFGLQPQFGAHLILRKL